MATILKFKPLKTFNAVWNDFKHYRYKIGIGHGFHAFNLVCYRTKCFMVVNHIITKL